MNSMHLAKPNVYQTLVLVWRHLRPVRRNIDRYLRPIGFPPLFWLNRNCEITGSTAFRLQERRTADTSLRWFVFFAGLTGAARRIVLKRGRPKNGFSM